MAIREGSTAVVVVLMLNLLFMSTVNCCTTCAKPKPKPKPKPCISTPSAGHGMPAALPGKCPVDTLKLGVCANLLGGLVNLNLGSPPEEPCCTLLHGLADLEAAVCLCTTIRAGVLGINLSLPVNLSLLLNYCGKNAPAGFQCV